MYMVEELKRVQYENEKHRLDGYKDKLKPVDRDTAILAFSWLFITAIGGSIAVDKMDNDQWLPLLYATVISFLLFLGFNNASKYKQDIIDNISSSESKIDYYEIEQKELRKGK